MNDPSPAPPEPEDPLPAGLKAEAPLGPGALILVVGPSGAGKDTLITLARLMIGPRGDVAFARRLVTRPEGAGEAHGTLTEEAFEVERAAGRFPLSWRAHGLAYALGPEVAEAVKAGRVVVANGSRASLPEARARFARLNVVEITAPVELRAERLAARGRESADAIRERLARAPAVAVAPDLVIENSGPPEAGAATLARHILGLTLG